MVTSSDTPWSEKYRPRTLDEVAFHQDIIGTSMACDLLLG